MVAGQEYRINEINGNDVVNNASVFPITVPNERAFGNITMVNLGDGSEVACKQRFNPAEVIANFTDNCAVGINPFCLDAERGSGEKFHAVG